MAERLPGNPAFLDLPPDLTDADRSRVAVLCLPYEASTTYQHGTRNAPAAILTASSQLEVYDEELDCEPCGVGISTLQPISKFSGDPETAIRQIRSECGNIIATGKFIASIGGEHSVTAGLVQAYKEKYHDLFVLQLDAHTDLRDNYQGSSYNHACVMARVNEICPYLGIGIRSAVSGEGQQLNQFSKIMYAHEMITGKSWQQQALSFIHAPVYITIDLDFFDPSVVPSVGTPEPGGFDWYTTLSFLKQIFCNFDVVGFDVVELCPRPGFPASDFLAAKLIYKMIGYKFINNLQAGTKKNLDY
jgi:agmatinase